MIKRSVAIASIPQVAHFFALMLESKSNSKLTTISLRLSNDDCAFQKLALSRNFCFEPIKSCHAHELSSDGRLYCSSNMNDDQKNLWGLGD